MALRVVDAPAPRSGWTWALALAPGWLALHWALQQRFPPPLGFSLAFTVLGVLPAVAAPSFFGPRALALGLGLGAKRAGTALVALGVPLAILVAWVAAGIPAIAAVYPMTPGVTERLASFAPHAGLYLLYYAGFEFFFRGFLLLGLVERLGPFAANLFQAGLATLVHFDKPGVELAVTFPASLLFGWMTLRTGSIWYAVLVHWVAGVALDWLLL